MRYIVNGQFANITTVINGKEVDVIETILKQQSDICDLLTELAANARLIGLPTDKETRERGEKLKVLYGRVLGSQETYDQLLNNEAG